jgi:hypothetical protein
MPWRPSQLHCTTGPGKVPAKISTPVRQLKQQYYLVLVHVAPSQTVRQMRHAWEAVDLHERLNSSRDRLLNVAGGDLA